MSTNPPSNDPKDYNPKAIGTRPATAGTSANADNIRFTDSEVRFAANDGRPAVIAKIEQRRITLRPLHRAARQQQPVRRLLFQTVNGYCVAGGADTNGGALQGRDRQDPARQHRTAAAAAPSPNRYEAEDGGLLTGSTADADTPATPARDYGSTPPTPWARTWSGR